MKIVLFYHSLISDWNHGNAHFLRGVNTALLELGHEVITYEPENGWSLQSLIKDQGKKPLEDFKEQFPHLKPHFYDPENFDPDALLQDADLVIVHEWNDPKLVSAVGDYHRGHDFTLLFHDTHHRAVSASGEMEKYDLSAYDGVLAFGGTLANIYDSWGSKVWVWHEAADTSTYYPIKSREKLGDIVWVGNWGDEERTAELHEFLIEPIKELGLKAKFYGVRYPGHALEALEEAGIEYGGWLPTNKVAETFSKYRATVHVPRKFYRDNLPGIPTIRPFEAMACKIPLISAPWQDTEHLFDAGRDYLMALDGEEMKDLVYKVLNNPQTAQAMAERAYQTILNKHTCMHRAHELMDIHQNIVAHRSFKLTSI